MNLQQLWENPLTCTNLHQSSHLQIIRHTSICSVQSFVVAGAARYKDADAKTLHWWVGQQVWAYKSLSSVNALSLSILIQCCCKQLFENIEVHCVQSHFCIFVWRVIIEDDNCVVKYFFWCKQLAEQICLMEMIFGWIINRQYQERGRHRVHHWHIHGPDPSEEHGTLPRVTEEEVKKVIFNLLTFNLVWENLPESQQSNLQMRFRCSWY